MLNFEDNIGLMVLKMIIWYKQTLSVKDIFKSDHLEWSYGKKCSILMITQGKHNINIVKIQVTKYNLNMDLALIPPYWAKVRHRWNQNWSQSGPYIQI